MLYMPIHKDVLKYRIKVFLGLTSRMLGFGAAGAGLGVLMGLYLSFVLFMPPTSALGQVAIAAVSLPCLACAFARPQGLPFEEWARLRLLRATRSQRIPYVQTAPARRYRAGSEERERVRTDKAYRRLARRRGAELWSPDGTGLD